MEFILFLEQMKKSIAKRKEIPTKSLEGSTQAQPQKWSHKQLLTW